MVPFSLIAGLIVFLALLAVIGMAVTAVVCLTRCRGVHRKWLAVWSGAFLTAAVLATVGSWLLKQFHLAWRSNVLYVLFAVIFFCGLGGLYCVLRCLPELLAGLEPPAQRFRVIMARAACVLIVFCTLTLGPFAAAFSAWGDWVADRNGQRVVMVNESWMDFCVVCYDYRGPLVRGSTALEFITEPGQLE